MSERDIKRWQDTIAPRDKAPHPWTIGSGGSWDMMEVQPIPDAMLAELAQRYQYAGTPWNCRSMPLSESDREYMYMLYYGMQGLVARLRLAEKERDFAKTEIARLHDDIRELTDVRVLDEEDRDRIVAWRQGTSAKPAPSIPEGWKPVPIEVIYLYSIMCAAFVPMTPQQKEIALQLDLAKRAMLAATPEAKP